MVVKAPQTTLMPTATELDAMDYGLMAARAAKLEEWKRFQVAWIKTQKELHMEAGGLPVQDQVQNRNAAAALMGWAARSAF